MVYFIIERGKVMDCNVCSEAYDLGGNRIPFVLGCGHSVCSKCLQSLMIEECPTCRLTIQSRSKNYSLMEMMERSKKETPTKRLRKDIEQLFKVSVVGGSNVGKTTMIHYITKGEFNSKTIPTVGVDFAYIDREINSKIYRYQLWDTAGQEQFRCIAKNHYLNSDVILLVYSVNQPSTLDQIEEYWIKEIEQVAPQAKIILIGNKSDLSKQTSSERVQRFCREHNAPHYQISCRTNKGVLTVWEHIVSYLFKMKSHRDKRQVVRIHRNADQNKGMFRRLKKCWSFLF